MQNQNQDDYGYEYGQETMGMDIGHNYYTDCQNIWYGYGSYGSDMQPQEQNYPGQPYYDHQN
jgi:hypothetical protein